MAKTRAMSSDVQWHLPNKKRPFAYSTKATSDLIVTLAQTFETIQNVYDNIIYDYEAKSILRVYIERGYGQCKARNFFK